MLLDEFPQRESLERMHTIQPEIKIERQVGRRGGSGKWPFFIVLLICELLVNGTPPSYVPVNIQTTSAALTGTAAFELPSVDFVRKCRVVLQTVNELCLLLEYATPRHGISWLLTELLNVISLSKIYLLL